MLDLSHLTRALTAKRAHFSRYDRQAASARKQYREAWTRLRRLGPAGLSAPIPADARPGARLGREWAASHAGIVGGGCAFGSHAEAHAWAAEQLAGRMTVGVDASQIEPLPDVTLPVAVVQVARFLNPHQADIPYVKAAETHVLSPVELTGGELEPKSELVCRRFELETAALADQLRELAGQRPLPVAFYDGPLVISFADRAGPPAQARYLKAMRQLLAASRETGIPLVGYIDSSQARDLASLVAATHGLDEDHAPIDALLVADDLAWGQRTAAAACTRPGVWQQLETAAGGIDFCYVRVHAGLPARLEFPRWVTEAGLLPQVVAAVLAECVAGQGFPYALEVADATAVLSVADRDLFRRTLEAFAATEGFPLPRSHKALSKGRRRT